ncbi:MAG: hypothetical protein B1H07_02645 [Campylobacteraceae bacterium 4484_166]|nr:MAG: hypothetical protein B1H07_02645 [Campylobacteraceae bacterium 4484_166]
MRVISRYLSFMIPLVFMLLSYELYITLDRSVSAYKQKVTDNYTIVIISQDKLTNNHIDNLSINYNKLKELSKDEIIDSFKKQLSDESLQVLIKELPYFYKLYLNEFPNKKQLKAIQNELKTISQVIDVEVFSKKHNQQFSMFLMLNNFIAIFFIVVMIFSILMILKHIKIWFYEHKEQIYIMQLHGANIFYYSKELIFTAFVSAVLASIITILMTFFIAENLSLFVSSELLKLDYFQNQINLDYFNIFGLSILISATTVLFVLVKQKYEN